MKSFRLLALLVATVFLSISAVAKPPHDVGNPGKGNGQPESYRDHSDDMAEDVASLVLAGITASQARDLAEGYHISGGKPLPPGIRKNLARGKPIPPGIAKQRMPASMLDSLPYHEGYEWHRYGTDLVLVSAASEVIADVLIDVFD